MRHPLLPVSKRVSMMLERIASKRLNWDDRVFEMQDLSELLASRGKTFRDMGLRDCAGSPLVGAGAAAGPDEVRVTPSECGREGPCV